ncbi:PTB domain-containing engulfment adapter protein 1-like isoform X2 [Artemia franciscana]|uniref:PTB domain-containing engulfment adapter protein 1-like isoform X2 n=1 Tax=Artemia franciscana TaxID=6661 RepID=UPI0032DBBB36
MKTGNLLKWTNNNRNSKNGNRLWIHPPDALTAGHVAYLVKFLGSTEVSQPKGQEVVKEGIRKLRFNHQVKKAEGQKSQKVEVTISIDGVAVQDSKSKKILYQYPLHRISYCADDKAEKKFFSFIAKESDSDVHICFVFVSEKLAEEITLTIGQAFDLAYKRFLEGTGRDIEVKRQVTDLQSKIRILENEKLELRKRLKELSAMIPATRLQTYLNENNISDILHVEEFVENPSRSESPQPAENIIEGELVALSIDDIPEEEKSIELPPVPPRMAASLNHGELLNKPNSLFSDLNPEQNGYSSSPQPVLLSNGFTASVSLSAPITQRSSRNGTSPAKGTFGADPFLILKLKYYFFLINKY